MTTKAMLTSLTNYYGERYTGILETMVAEYLDALSDPIRDKLFMLVVRKVSRSFGKVPDIAAFEAVLPAALEAATTDRLTLPEAPDLPTESEQAEVARLIADARRTSLGRWLFGPIVPEASPSDPRHPGQEYPRETESDARMEQVNRFTSRRNTL